MENLSEHRDRANKMDSNELRTTHPIHIWLREICQRWELAWLVGSPTTRQPKRRYGSAAIRELVSDRVLRKFLPATLSTRSKMISREQHEY